ncbi:Glucokinase [wastewater metagenome]|uniref:Glucokinase n=2 Tax=unclassified sequences TaxID=12908 RepID=A0A5B8RHV8_9ZZZZ|nr:glucokinase [Arhodomonas sp. KWT]QEA07518.1 glucokinase [uncultured organism]
MTTTHASPPWLIADIGGTGARFALASPGDGSVHHVRELATADFADLAAAAGHYLDGLPDGPRPRQALCAIAAPIAGDQVELTNGSWRFSTTQTRDRLGLERLELVNDFVAQALAVPGLSPTECVPVNPGAAAPGAPMAVLGPGTGLGVSVLVPCPGGGHHAIGGEGGHVSFAPCDEREEAVARALRQRFGHCSAERVASGVGLTAVHDCLAEIAGAPTGGLSPAEIIAGADAGDARAAETLALFTRGLATVAAGLALTVGARGGVYLGGGILPRLGNRFDHAMFMTRFTAKGRMRDYLATIPVWRVDAPLPALAGLAHAVTERG